MRYDVLRSVVNRHSCSIGETRYAFTLTWVAVQQSPENRDARLLLRVEAIPASGPGRKRVLLHLFTGLAPVEDLRAMLDEALLQHFAEEQHEGVVKEYSRPATMCDRRHNKGIGLRVEA